MSVFSSCNFARYWPSRHETRQWISDQVIIEYSTLSEYLHYVMRHLAPFLNSPWSVACFCATLHTLWVLGNCYCCTPIAGPSTLKTPVPSSRLHLSSGACLEARKEDNQNCSVLRCVRQLCTMIHTHTCESFLHFLFLFVCLFRFCLLCVLSC